MFYDEVTWMTNTFHLKCLQVHFYSLSSNRNLIYYRDSQTVLSLLPGVLRLLALKGWNGPNSWPSRCVPNPTNSTPQLPADAAGQSGRPSSIPKLYYYPQSRQQHSDTNPKSSHSFKPTFLEFLASLFFFFNISQCYWSGYCLL